MGTKQIKKILAALGLIVFWQIAALIAENGGQYTATLVPTWGSVLKKSLSGFASFRSGGLPNYGDATYVILTNSLITVKRVLLGMAIGGVTGIITGIIIGLQPILRGMFYPVVKVLRNIPLLALVSLFLVWFGGEEIGIIIYIAFGLWIIYATNTIEAIDNADRIRINFARTLGAKNGDIYKDVILPMIIPNLINATKVALGVAWAIALGGEFLAAQNGLGRLLIVSQQYMETGRMLIILIVFIILTAVFGWVVNVIGKRITRWMP